MFFAMRKQDYKDAAMQLVRKCYEMFGPFDTIYKCNSLTDRGQN